ncbi:MAG: transposase [Betaproteobacteria bacterium]|nr:transposase [Betaproteobacteria bacterium]
MRGGVCSGDGCRPGGRAFIEFVQTFGDLVSFHPHVHVLSADGVFLADGAEGRKKLAGYMLRALLSLAKMTYDAASGTVIYRSKMHLGLKRDFQLMPGAEWLKLFCKHIPDRYEQLVRYVGCYSSRSRGARKAKGATAVAITASGVIEVLGEYASRAKLAWARLIRKVYEADPRVCGKCQGPMRVIALESRIRRWSERF